MERARDSKGRFVMVERVAEPDEEWGGPMAGELAKAPRPKHWSTYTKARFAEALPQLMHVLVREAKRGSVAHLKLLVVICGLNQGKATPEKAKHQEKNLEQILMEDWKRQEEREADERDQAMLERFAED